MKPDPTTDPSTAISERPIRIAVVDNDDYVHTAVAGFALSRPSQLLVVAKEFDVEGLGIDTNPPPHIVVLDLFLGANDDTLSTGWIRRLDDWGARVLLNTREERPARIREAYEQGIAGLCLKRAGAEALFDAILEVASGGFPLTPVTGHALLHGKDIPHLSPRQVEVLELVRDGYNNAEIAESLFIAESTVKDHLKAVARTYRDHGRRSSPRSALVAEVSKDGFI